MDKLLRDALKDTGYNIYHWELAWQGRRRKLVVYIDKPGGVTIDDCVQASRAIEALLEEEDPIPGSYVLEVSSPGLERGLWEPDHYRAAVGETIQVELLVPRAGRKRLKGKLLEVGDKSIKLEVQGKVYDLPLVEVRRAHVVYEPEGI